MSNVLIFATDLPRPLAELMPEIGSKLSISIEKPTLFQALRDRRTLSELVWWLFDVLRVFSNRHYAVCKIRANGRTVHQSIIFPKFFRFRFMGEHDLQIGNTWTEEGYRGRGLAGMAVRAICAHFCSPSRRMWYVVAEDNSASIHVITKEGFSQMGRGHKRPRLGLKILGYYEIVV